jgi:hypothetical protein
MELQIYRAQIDPSPESDLEVDFVGLVDRPAIERNFQAFNKSDLKVGDQVQVIPGAEHSPDHKDMVMTIAEISGSAIALKMPDGTIHKWYIAPELKKVGAPAKMLSHFSVLNGEKRIIGGPAMIAGMPLYRKDAELGEYYVVFEKQDIYTIATKFAAKGYMNNLNLFHDQQQKVSDVTIFNSFIADAELGVSPMRGYEDLPDGTWFIHAKVNNEQVWEKVKNGEIKGFSVEGLFNYVPVAKVVMSAEARLAAIEKLLSGI